MVVASQLTGKIEITGADNAKTILLNMADSSKKTQDQLDNLQKAAKDAGNILSSRFSSDLKTAQGGLQDLAKRAESAGLDVSKFASLQAKASEAAAKLGLAQAQAADMMARADAITNDASASAEKIALAQARAAVSAENVQKAEMAAGEAMTMVQGEATRLADALEMSQAKGGMFSGVLGGLKEGASGFFGAIAAAPAKLGEATQKLGFFIFGAQQIIQTGQQMADTFIGLGKSAGDFQSGITSLETGAGELHKNLGMVSDGILKLAPDVGATTKELEAGMFTIESSGQRGANALEILKNAAEGAKVGNADLADVANGVTTALTDYGLSAKDSASVTNDLIATVGAGKTTMGELSASLKDVLPISSSAGISLNGVSAAMATMTGEGVPAGQAANYLRGMILALEAPSLQGAKTLASIGLSAQDVASEMKDSLPGALQMITDHLKQKFPEGSAAYTAALKEITGGSESLTAMIDLTGDHMKVFEGNVDSIYNAVRKGGTGIAGWAQVQQNFNFQLDKAKEGVEVLQIKLGEKLLPIFSQVFGWVSSTAIPALGAFSDWFFDKGVPALQQFVAPLQTAGHWFQDFVGHGQAAIPILTGIGAVIATFLVPAVASLAVSVATATWPFLLIAGAVAGLTAAFLHFYNSNAGFRDFINSVGQSFINLWNIVSTQVQPMLQRVGAFIADTFAPVWEQLVDVWKSQLQPALAGLWDSLQPLMPTLKFLGEIIGGILVGAVVLFVGAIGGLIGALAGIMHGVAEVIGGVVQIIAGFIQTVTGIVTFLVDLFTGHFDKLGGDLKTIFGGIGEIFSGFGNVLKGIVDGIVGGIVGAFKGMGTAIIGSIMGIATGVDEQTKKASIASQLNTAEMKDKSIANAQKQNEGMQAHYQQMRTQIENELSQTTDVVQRKTLEQKLAAVNNALAMSQETGRKYVDMRNKSQEQLDLLKQGIDVSLMSASEKAQYHSLNTKKNYLDGVIAMDNESIQKVDHMRQGIIDELSRTTDGAKKHSLEMKLTETTHAEEAAKNVRDSHVKMRTDTENEMDKLKNTISEKSQGAVGAIKGFFGGIGNWFHDRWVDIQNAWGGLGKWFQDRGHEAWNGITSFFGGIGHWFQDRWHDIQNVFAGIGKWFGDKFAEIYAPIKPVVDYMGAVFETVGRIVHAIFDKLGAYFRDRWNEALAAAASFVGMLGDKIHQAWDKVVGAFQFLGNWFHDRWVEVSNGLEWLKNIIGDKINQAWTKVTTTFAPIGGWFHDKWNEVVSGAEWLKNLIGSKISEAWNKVTTTFAPLGGWFHEQWQKVVNGAEWLKNTVMDKFNALKTGAANIFKGLVNGIIDQLNNGISAAVGFINFFARGLNDLAKNLTGTPGTIPIIKYQPIPHYAAGTPEGGHPGGFAMVGERGRELTWLPRGAQVVPNNITEMILSMSGGAIPGYADGIGDIGDKIMQWVAGGAKSVLDNVISSLGIKAPDLPGMGNIASGIFNKVKDWALGWIDKILPKFSFGGEAVNVPGSLRDWIAQAMTITGVPASWASPLAVIAMHESGGNPSAINLWDINAIQGHPSQGLFQTIPSTFAAYSLPGHNNILNPVDSGISAIRYIQSRYGDVFHVPGIMEMAAGRNYIGYSQGGLLTETVAGKGLRTGSNYLFAENGPETIIPGPYIPSGVNLASQTSPTVNITVNVQPNDFNIDGRKLARALIPHHVDLVRMASGAKI